MFAILDYVPLGVFALREDFVVAFWNACLENWTGIPRQDIMGRPLAAHFPHLLEEPYKSRLDHIFGGSAPVVFSPYLHRHILPVVLPNRQHQVQHTTVIAVPGQDGKGFYALFTVEDVTELVSRTYKYREMRDQAQQVAEERRRAEQVAAEASQAKSRFLANMSHEIRTPMNAILGFAELLDSELGEARHREYLAAIRRSGNTLLELINDILDLSKVEAGKLELHYAPVDLRLLLRELGQIFSYKLREKGLELHLDIAPEVPARLSLDATRLRQVLLNLLGNAAKFTEHGHVRLHARQEPGPVPEQRPVLLLEVEDTGIGIAESEQASIFEPFIQQEGQNYAKYGGTGLGLSITKRLVEMMGGEIRLHSRPGQGSVFQVRLRDVESLAPPPAPSAPETAAAPAPPVHLRAATLLIADDLEINRKLLREYLREQTELRIVEAQDGEEAVRLAREAAPDLVLLDYKMPVRDGYETACLLRQQAATRHLPLVMLSAAALPETTEQAIRAVCDAYLPRPVGKAKFLETLARFLATQPAAASPPAPPMPPALREHLVAQAAPQWQQLSQSCTLDELESFGAAMRALGERHAYPPLRDWGDALQRQAAAFDAEQIFTTLQGFSAFLAPA